MKYGDLEFDFGKPFERITLHDATIKYGADKGIVKEDLYDFESCKKQPLTLRYRSTKILGLRLYRECDL